MKYFCLILLFCAQFVVASDYDWGKTGHRVTGAIAENYLSEKAKTAISTLLDGESLAMTSTYADEIKSDRDFRPYSSWHYVNIPFDKTYETHPKNPNGDIIQGIEKCISVLKSDASSIDDKRFYLKLLVHFIGDLHQPLHTGLQEDKGGNDFQVRWFDEGTNLHAVWDTKMIENYNMSYDELANNLTRLHKYDVEMIQQGSVIDWMEESRGIIKEVYQTTKSGEKLGYRYMYDYFGTVKDQLFKGGVRLAHILNKLFD